VHTLKNSAVLIRAKMRGRKDKIREFDFDSEMREQDAYADNPLANNPLANQGYRATADDFEVDTQENATDSSLPSQERSPKGSLEQSMWERGAEGNLTRKELRDVKLPADTKIELYDQMVQTLSKKVETQSKDLDIAKNALWVESKIGASKTDQKRAKVVLKKLLSEDGKPLHISPNTMGTIRSHERSGNSLDKLTNDDFVYAFVFKMPANTPGADEVGEDELFISHECWITVEQMISCDLAIKVVLPVHRHYMIVAVGADYKVCIDEAYSNRILMRMQDTKGSLEFHPDLIRYYASNHGGLNEYVDGHWIKRDPSQSQDGKHWQPIEGGSEEEANQAERDHKMFTSAIKQRLVLSRLKRRAGYDPEHTMALTGDNKKALKYIEKGCVIGTKMNIGASVFNDVLRSIGGYRPENNVVFKDLGDEINIVYEISRMVAVDPDFVLKNDGVKQMLSSQVSVAVDISTVV
jgi:hypothetical protein